MEIDESFNKIIIEKIRLLGQGLQDHSLDQICLEAGESMGKCSNCLISGCLGHTCIDDRMLQRCCSRDENLFSQDKTDCLLRKAMVELLTIYIIYKSPERNWGRLRKSMNQPELEFKWIMKKGDSDE